MASADPRTFTFHPELLDHVAQAVVATDTQGHITYWNRYAEVLYGWTADEVIGRRVEAIVPASASQAEAERIMDSLRRGETWAGVFQVRRRDGTEFCAHVMTAPICRDGETVGMAGVSVALGRDGNAESRHRALLVAAPDPIFRVSRSGYILEYTGPAHARLVIQADMLLGRHISVVLPPLVSEQCEQAIDRAIATQSVVTVEYELEKDRGRRLYEARIAPCGDDEVIGIVRDVTRTRRFQDELRARVAERTEEIALLSRHLVAMQDEEWRRIGRELHDEVGQVVTALSMIIAAAQNDPAAAEARLNDASQLVRRLREGVQRLSLDLISPLHDGDVLAALRDHVESFSRRTDLPIDYAADPVDGLSESAAVAVFRIVQEALTNVARHAGATRASVRLSTHDDVFFVEVSDDGRGFNEVARRRAGLLGMHQRALLVGASLSIDSAVGAGTRVTMTLPLREARP